MKSPKKSKSLTNNALFENCHRLWLGNEDEVGAVRLFRRTFSVSNPTALQSATCHIFADSKYHLWINGTYLGRGPTFFHPHRRPVTTYDLHPFLHLGQNTVAVLVYSPCISLHNYVPSGHPGLITRIDLTDINDHTESLLSDHAWKATAESGWLGDTPRRTWAIAFVECYDARIAPRGWQHQDFDDSTWKAAEELPLFHKGYKGTFIENDVPALRFYWAPVKTLLDTRIASGPTHTFHREDEPPAYAQALMQETWEPLHNDFTSWGELNDQGGGIVLEGCRPDRNMVLLFDLGAQYTGSISFDMASDSEGLIDIGWAELVEDGKPQILRKRNSYADRYLAHAGANHWFPHSFNSGRYIAMIFRGFKGTIRLHRVGMLACEPLANWAGEFKSENKTLNAIWHLCERSLRVGTQEGLMDCPTREQAAYIGDGNPTAAWIGRVTGDYRHWRHLIRETFAVQGQDGQIKTTVFSGMTGVLIDYSLLAIIGCRDYYRETGDLDTVTEILPAADRLIQWYREKTNAVGLFDYPSETFPTEWLWVKNPATAYDTLKAPGLILFIDHPGMGWHNREDPGIDRRGLNAGINALYALTLRALADLHDACKSPAGAAYREAADKLVQAAREIFWSRSKGLFVDGMLKGKRLRQVSQQTNTWCIMSGMADSDKAREILRKITTSSDPTMARSGPYFWTYMFPALVEMGLADLALESAEKLWAGMLTQGATTLWETFSGDYLDSYCHPWSGAPVEFLLRDIAGIGSLPHGQSQIDLKPRPDLLEEVDARAFTAQGPVTIRWVHREGHIEMSGILPPKTTGLLYLPARTTPITLTGGEWAIREPRTPQ